MDKEAPATVSAAADEAFDRWAADRSVLAKQIGGTPDLAPLAALMHSRHTPAVAKGSLLALAEGAWPSQASLFEEGLVDDPLCLLCKKRKGYLYAQVLLH